MGNDKEDDGYGSEIKTKTQQGQKCLENLRNHEEKRLLRNMRLTVKSSKTACIAESLETFVYNPVTSKDSITLITNLIIFSVVKILEKNY
ncbi:hypothetical protein RB195_013543 [Necator americanus]|uniref:Uncharacterized protein n=1 Tax=Necator americanus TaxID=51031 RepID=A0ABR1DW17_NECAM